MEVMVHSDLIIVFFSMERDVGMDSNFSTSQTFNKSAFRTRTLTYTPFYIMGRKPFIYHCGALLLLVGSKQITELF